MTGGVLGSSVDGVAGGGSVGASAPADSACCSSGMEMAVSPAAPCEKGGERRRGGEDIEVIEQFCFQKKKLLSKRMPVSS